VAYVLLRAARGDELTQPTDLRTTGLAPFSTVNAIACQKGFCAALSDPGASGLGMATVQPASPPAEQLAQPQAAAPDDQQLTEQPSEQMVPDPDAPSAQQLTRQ
jgi:hypothetical protein